MIGDSLTVGTQAYMPESIDGAPVQIDATSGIPIAEGMRRYERHQARGNMPRVVEMALFTNNSPDQIGQLRGSIDTTIRDAHARGGRVVWATIVRPGDYSEANDLIRAKAAENPDVMGVVDWEKMVAEDPGLVGGDGVHATAKGYEARAEAFTEAARD